MSNRASRVLIVDDEPQIVRALRSGLRASGYEVLSAFAWASESGYAKASDIRFGSIHSRPLEPFRQAGSPKLDVDFNQDFSLEEDANQDAFGEGTRVAHPTFGKGKVTAKRGDIVTIRFDDGQTKTFALSIAPLTML